MTLHVKKKNQQLMILMNAIKKYIYIKRGETEIRKIKKNNLDLTKQNLLCCFKMSKLQLCNPLIHSTPSTLHRIYVLLSPFTLAAMSNILTPKNQK